MCLAFHLLLATAFASALSFLTDEEASPNDARNLRAATRFHHMKANEA